MFWWYESFIDLYRILQRHLWCEGESCLVFALLLLLIVFQMTYRSIVRWGMDCLLEFILWILQIIGFLHFRLSYIIVEIPLFVLRSKDFEGNNWFLELPVNHLLWVWACFGWLWAVISDVFVYFVFFLILLFYMIEVFVRCWFVLMFWWSCRCQIEYEWHWAPSLINGRNYSC